MNWGLTISTTPHRVTRLGEAEKRRQATGSGSQQLFVDARTGLASVPTYRRSQLLAGDWMTGPALIVEGQTTTFVGARFDAVIDKGGNIVMTRKTGDGD
jgi:N-methylhydantoinase A